MDALGLAGIRAAGFALVVSSVMTVEVRSDDAAAVHWTQPCNVVWTTPSRDAAGSMPLGNGEVGLNLWVEPDGDLRFYISRTDSLSELSRLLKVGRVRVSLSPNPFKSTNPFRQELVLRDGICEITAGEGENQVKLRVFVDSDYPVVHVAGQSASPVTVRAHAESWRTQRRVLPKGEEQNSAWSLHDAPFELFESADEFPSGLTDAVAWYHHNQESVAFASTLKVQLLESAAGAVHDPLWQRTFGGWMAGAGFRAAEGHALQIDAPARSFALRIAVPCMQTPTGQGWLDEAKKTADACADVEAAWHRTAAWWQAYWDRSWVITDGGRGVGIPMSQHALRIGYDSHGQNRFPGKLGRVSVFQHALPAKQIEQLKALDTEQPLPAQMQPVVSGQGTLAEIPNERLDFHDGLTLEAWIRVEGPGPGRIFDKLSAGGTDGFLFDTHPGDTLRLIVGNLILSADAGMIKPGAWHHAAATVDTATGALCIYLDGKVVAERPGTLESPIMRGYTLQRYVQACEGRGKYPIKFNGGNFTVEPLAMGKPFNPDWRAWGDCHWWQNVRHMYHPMLASGDVEMTEPLFSMYEAARPLAEARTKLYHDAEGSYFPETMTVWGTYSNGDYGWNRNGHAPRDVLCPYWQYAWNQGLELVSLMLDRWDYTADEAFLKTRVVPMAESVLKYFDTRFKKDADGKIILNPTQAVETFWQNVTNDMPSVAGLKDITARLCALPEAATSARQRAFFIRMKAACPDVPLEEVNADGQRVRRLAPAQQYDRKPTNCENPELYGIWPFRLFGLGKPGLDEARKAYELRVNHLDCGWGYDGNCAALLGLSDEAGRILMVKCANSHPKYRWPATWGPNFDWLPDQNHGGNLLETTQLMLLQGDGDKIRVLPAWPRNWNVTFRLWAPHRTVVECVYRNGNIDKLQVTPESRRNDVVLPDGMGGTH